MEERAPNRQSPQAKPPQKPPPRLQNHQLRRSIGHVAKPRLRARILHGRSREVRQPHVARPTQRYKDHSLRRPRHGHGPDDVETCEGYTTRRLKPLNLAATDAGKLRRFDQTATY